MKQEDVLYFQRQNEMKECTFLIHSFTFLKELDSTSGRVLYLVFVINGHCNLPDIKHIWAYTQANLMKHLCAYVYNKPWKEFLLQKIRATLQISFYYLIFKVLKCFWKENREKVVMWIFIFRLFNKRAGFSSYAKHHLTKSVSVDRII